ncbi:hypothetical protein [Methanobrevibacter sp. V14]|uniref:hypothetical protein n=1 Tax=Methanobrevibacter sp. V14 TaxID=3064280 RepID=UPI0027344BC9|nr:hypothetical protein [Methanobrevibacter sp. V14]
MINNIISILSLLLIPLIRETQDDKSTILNPRYSNEQKHHQTMIQLNQFCHRNFYVICVAAIIILLLVFILFCFWIVGVSSVESGTFYNHMEAII